ncbi:MAG: hypothetical protein GY707_11560, partial [Desulfobacteraceae bacterium]|nr:hypothetical protein [Desulfobacteraceae bacterium]
LDSTIALYALVCGQATESLANAEQKTQHASDTTDVPSKVYGKVV